MALDEWACYGYSGEPGVLILRNFEIHSQKNISLRKLNVIESMVILY